MYSNTHGIRSGNLGQGDFAEGGVILDSVGLSFKYYNCLSVSHCITIVIMAKLITITYIII